MIYLIVTGYKEIAYMRGARKKKYIERVCNISLFSEEKRRAYVFPVTL